MDGPVLSAPNICYELAEKTKAIAHGGIGAIHRLVQRVGLATRIDTDVRVLKVHQPYYESDHVLNIAYNLLPPFDGQIFLERHDPVGPRARGRLVVEVHQRFAHGRDLLEAPIGDDTVFDVGGALAGRRREGPLGAPDQGLVQVRGALCPHRTIVAVAS